MKHIYVVIPGHNESRYLATVLKKVKAYTDNIIFVDDGSSDDSSQIAKKFTSHVLTHETNLGKGAAMKTGAEYAFDVLGASGIIFMDADDQHDARHIPEFSTMLSKADVVFGVRNMGPSMPLFRFLGNKFASVFLNVLFGSYIADIPSGYKAISKRVWNKVAWNATGYEVEAEIAMHVAKRKIPFATVEIESIYHDTDKGMTLLDALHISACLLQWRIGI